MEKSYRFAFFVPIILIFFVNPCLCVHICKPSYCSEFGIGPEIRFPFWIRGQQQKQRCGYLGFGLSCNELSQTILTLPSAGDFLVNRIDYTSQSIYINDPNFCLPERISKFNVRGSPFIAAPEKNYTFFNCSSSDWIRYTTNRPVPLFCLSKKNFTVLATSNSNLSDQDLPPSCRRMPNVSVPLQLSVTQYWSSTVLSEDIELTWNRPNCQKCEAQQLYCGFSSDAGLEVGCSGPPKRGLPRGVKYGITIGVGIPALVCITGLACYVCSKIRNLGEHQNTAELSVTVVNPPSSSVYVTGLDVPTIESYPKTVVGESGRLPKPHYHDVTCPICLCDYQPKETIRTIPECNHFFHSNCIDEWLQLNGTCPLCRNTPESMTVTPCSSTSSSTVSSSSAISSS